MNPTPTPNTLPAEVQGGQTPTILATSLSPTHTFSKFPQTSIHLLAGLGVEGDAHCGATVRHRYLRRRNPHAPNRAQVHLINADLLDTLALDPALLPPLHPGDLGENLTIRHLDLCILPLATRLHLGATAIVELPASAPPAA